MNNYKIIVDSGCDISNDYSKNNNISIVPLSIDIDNKIFIDDLNININELLAAVQSSNETGKTSCPSPEQYMSEFKSFENIFVITLSSKVSGSFNSASLAKQLYLEDNANTNIHIIDSYSASAAQCLIVDNLISLINENKYTFDEICQIIDSKATETKTFFVLDDMETLIKNGRIKGMKAFLVSKLNMKAIMTQKNGEIVQFDVARGINKTLQKIAKYISDSSKYITKLYISHVDANDKVEYLLNELKTLNPSILTKIIINNTRGIATFYANKGGIILAF